MNKRKKPKFIRCQACGYKERKVTEIEHDDQVPGLEGFYVVFCSNCSRMSTSLRGNLNTPEALDFVDNLMETVGSLEAGVIAGTQKL